MGDIPSAGTSSAGKVEWLSPTCVTAWVKSNENVEARRNWVIRYVHRIKCFTQTEAMKKGEAFDARIKAKLDQVLGGTSFAGVAGGSFAGVAEPFTDCYMNSGAWSETLRLCTGCVQYGLDTTIKGIKTDTVGVVPTIMKPDWWWISNDQPVINVLDWKTKTNGSPLPGYYIRFAGSGSSRYTGSVLGNAVDKHALQVGAYIAGIRDMIEAGDHKISGLAATGVATGLGYISEVMPDCVMFHRKEIDTKNVRELFGNVWSRCCDQYYFDWLPRDESDTLVRDVESNLELYSRIARPSW